MNWQAFLSVIAVLTGFAAMALGISYDRFSSSAHHNWLVGLFITCALSGALAAGLGA